MPSVDVAQLTLPIEITGNPVAKLEQVDTKLHEVAGGGAPAVERAADKAGTSVSKMGTGGVRAIGSLGNALSTTGDQFGPFQQGIGQVTNAIYGSQGVMDGWQQKMFVAGASLTGLGGIAINIGNQISDSKAKLQRAVSNEGDSWDKYSGQVDHAIDRGAHLGLNASEVQDGLARLVTGFGSTKKGLAEMSDAEDLAAFKHISLSQAAKELVRVNEGYGRGLKELGIDMTFSHNAADGLKSAHDAGAKAVEALQKAQQNELDVQARVAASGKDTVATQIEIRKAHDEVVAAQGRVADSYGKIVDASNKSDAEQKQGATALSLLHQKIAGQSEAQADTFGGRLRMIKADIFNFIGEIGQKYGGLITSAGITVMALSAIGPPLIAAASAMFTFVADAAAGMASLAVVAAPVVLPILAIVAAVALVIAAAYLLWTNWDQVWNWMVHHPALVIIASIVAAPITAFVLLIGGLKWMYDNWNTIWNAAVDVVRGVYNFLKPIIDAAITMFNDLVQFVSDLIHGNWSALWDDALHIVADIIAGIWAAVQVGIDAVVAIFTNAPGLIMGALSALAGLLWDLFTSALQAAYNGAMGAAGAVIGFFANLPGAIFGAIGDLAGSLWNVGADAVEGLWNGLKSKMESVVNWVKNKAQDIIDSFTSIFDLGSPSKVMHRIGVYVMQGFHQGMRAEAPTSLDFIGSFARDAISGFGMGGVGSTANRHGDGDDGFFKIKSGKNNDAPHIHIEVHGSTITERDLIETVRDGLVAAGVNNGGNYLGGTG